MAKLKDVMAYLIKNYPENIRHEMSNARLTKMIYLADWHKALTSNEQMTSIDWYFDNYGPFVHDVERVAASYGGIFSVNLGSNMHGQPKKSITLRDNARALKLTEEERISLDHIIDVTKRLYWDDFIKLVYATHPIASSERYSFLNLVEKADEYRKFKEVD
ncbi:MAG: SocA family protein [Robiginitomaculum sp.]|nr:SocA family protein [Robiginitomaculum sp.]